MKSSRKISLRSPDLTYYFWNKSTCVEKSGTLVECGCTSVLFVVAPPYAKFHPIVAVVLYVAIKWLIQW